MRALLITHKITLTFFVMTAIQDILPASKTLISPVKAVQKDGTKAQKAKPFVYHANKERPILWPTNRPVPIAPRADSWPPPKPLKTSAGTANRGTTKTKPPKQLAKDAPLVNGAIKRN